MNEAALAQGYNGAGPAYQPMAPPSQYGRGPGNNPGQAAGYGGQGLAQVEEEWWRDPDAVVLPPIGKQDGPEHGGAPVRQSGAGRQQGKGQNKGRR